LVQPPHRQLGKQQTEYHFEQCFQHLANRSRHHIQVSFRKGAVGCRHGGKKRRRRQDQHRINRFWRTGHQPGVRSGQQHHQCRAGKTYPKKQPAGTALQGRHPSTVTGSTVLAYQPGQRNGKGAQCDGVHRHKQRISRREIAPSGAADQAGQRDFIHRTNDLNGSRSYQQ